MGIGPFKMDVRSLPRNVGWAAKRNENESMTMVLRIRTCE